MLTDLLTQGRKIIADREAALEREREEHRAKMCELWAQARLAAIKLFEPLGAELPVQPVSPPEGWDPNFGKQHNVSFYVRPWKDAGCIVVRLCGRVTHIRRDDRGDAVNSKWEWSIDDERVKFYIESRFRVSDYDGDDGDEVFVFGESFDTTNDLAEALALCERHGEEYRRIKKAGEMRKARAAQPKAVKTETPADRLLVALEEWHDWVDAARAPRDE